MTELEESQIRARNYAAHNSALNEALTKANQELVQARAQIKVIAEAGAARLKEAGDLIDQLHQRIEFMVDTWQLQVRGRHDLPAKVREEILAEIEPFRPLRLGAATVEVPAPLHQKRD